MLLAVGLGDDIAEFGHHLEVRMFVEVGDDVGPTAGGFEGGGVEGAGGVLVDGNAAGPHFGQEGCLGEAFTLFLGGDDDGEAFVFLGEDDVGEDASTEAAEVAFE